MVRTANFDVVVPTFERPAALARCLTALTRQSTLPASVIVIDDHGRMPVDAAIPPDIADRLPLKIIRAAENGGPARSRNIGVAAGGADHILFVDDDVVARPNLIAQHARAHSTAGAPSAVIGPLKAPPDWRPTPWNRWEAETLEVEYQRMERGDYSPTWRQFFTGNASVRRADFERVGGFDERFRRAEDIELALRLAIGGCQFVFEPQAVGWHYANRTRESWRRIAADYVRFDVEMNALYPELHWLSIVDHDRFRRHPLTRAARACLRSVRAERAGAIGALTAATALHYCRRRASARALLSLAYSLEQSVALRETRAKTAAALPQRSQPRGSNGLAEK